MLKVSIQPLPRSAEAASRRRAGLQIKHVRLQRAFPIAINNLASSWPFERIN